MVVANKACLDNYLSGRGFEMLYRDLKGETLSAREIIDLFYQGNESAVDFVNLFVELAAISIGNIITAFDPHMIVLGGGLSNFDYLYEALPKALPPHLMRTAKVPPIKKRNTAIQVVCEVLQRCFNQIIQQLMGVFE